MTVPLLTRGLLTLIRIELTMKALRVTSTIEHKHEGLRQECCGSKAIHEITPNGEILAWFGLFRVSSWIALWLYFMT